MKGFGLFGKKQSASSDKEQAIEKLHEFDKGIADCSLMSFYGVVPKGATLEPEFKKNKDVNDKINTVIDSLNALDYIKRGNAQFRVLERPEYAIIMYVSSSITGEQLYSIAEIMLNAGIEKIPSANDKLIEGYKTVLAVAKTKLYPGTSLKL